MADGGRPRCPDQLACRWVAPAVAGPARGRPSNRARHSRSRPRRRCGGTAGPACPPRGAGAAPSTTPLGCPLAPANPSRSQWQRSSSMPTSGRPAPTHSGGTSNALLVGLAAHLAQRMGRVTADGSVLMKMPVNERTAGDTRANAVSQCHPSRSTPHLRRRSCARSGPQLKQALTSHQEQRDDERAVEYFIPLLGLLPKRLARLVDNTVVSSNLGVINPAVTRPDGTDAALWAARLSYRGVTKALMHRLGGVLCVLSGTALGQVFVSATIYQPGYTNSNQALRQDLSNALNERRPSHQRRYASARWSTRWTQTVWVSSSIRWSTR